MKIRYSKFCPNIPKKFSFVKLSDFDFSGNEKLKEFIYDWLSNKKGFCLYGNIGLGKTMLISILYRITCCESNSIFFTFNNIIRTMREFELINDFYSIISDCDTIFIDDIFKNFDSDIYTDKDVRNISNIIDMIYNDDKTLICTSMYDMSKLLKIPGWDNMFSRIKHMCSQIEIKGIDRRI